MSNKQSLKSYLISRAKRHGGLITKNDIEQWVKELRMLSGKFYSFSNAERRMRELASSGLIKRIKVKNYVNYKWIGFQVDQNPKQQTIKMF